jgi:alpha-tubulin suppressor-like RCC1 family protein
MPVRTQKQIDQAIKLENEAEKQRAAQSRAVAADAVARAQFITVTKQNVMKRQMSLKSSKSSLGLEVEEETTKDGLASLIAFGKIMQSIKDASAVVYSWGACDFGQCGDGRISDIGRASPIKIDALRLRNSPLDISAGTTHMAAISQEAKLFTWGSNEFGQLGHDLKFKTIARPMIVSVLKNLRVLQVSAGTYHTLVVTEGGAAWAFGTGREGQLGCGRALTFSPDPIRIPALGPEVGQSVDKVFAGRSTSAAITSTGSLRVWGDNEWGQLGLGPELARKGGAIFEPAEVNFFRGSRVTQVALGNVFSAFLVRNGELYVSGALGMTSEEWISRKSVVCWPTTTITFENNPVVTFISAGRGHLGVVAYGCLYTAGRGWLGGTAGDDASVEPVPVSELDSLVTDPGGGGLIVEVACGAIHTVVRTMDGRVFSFGGNATGALGVGEFNDRIRPNPETPLAIAPGMVAAKLAVGADFTAALMAPIVSNIGTDAKGTKPALSERSLLSLVKPGSVADTSLGLLKRFIPAGSAPNPAQDEPRRVISWRSRTKNKEKTITPPPPAQPDRKSIGSPPPFVAVAISLPALPAATLSSPSRPQVPSTTAPPPPASTPVRTPVTSSVPPPRTPAPSLMSPTSAVASKAVPPVMPIAAIPKTNTANSAPLSSLPSSVAPAPVPAPPASSKPPSATPASFQLPRNWTRILDDEGDGFFYNSITGQSTWSLWVTVSDPTYYNGTKYYVNCETQEAVWTKPADEGDVVV